MACARRNENATPLPVSVSTHWLIQSGTNLSNRSEIGRFWARYYLAIPPCIRWREIFGKHFGSSTWANGRLKCRLHPCHHSDRKHPGPPPPVGGYIFLELFP